MKKQRPRHKIELTLYSSKTASNGDYGLMGGYIHREAPAKKKSAKPDHRSGKFTRW